MALWCHKATWNWINIGLVMAFLTTSMLSLDKCWLLIERVIVAKPSSEWSLPTCLEEVQLSLVYLAPCTTLLVGSITAYILLVTNNLWFACSEWLLGRWTRAVCMYTFILWFVMELKLDPPCFKLHLERDFISMMSKRNIFVSMRMSNNWQVGMINIPYKYNVRYMYTSIYHIIYLNKLLMTN